MKRSTPLRRRTRLRPRSERAIEHDAELAALRRAAESELCEICRIRPMRHLHHKLRRSQGGAHLRENLMPLCRDCHDFVHRHPAESYRQGWLVRSGA